MNFVLTLLAGVLAAVSLAVATDTAKVDKHVLSHRETSMPEVMCDDSPATHVHLLEGGSVEKSIACGKDGRKRDMPLSRIASAEAFVNTSFDASAIVNDHIVARGPKERHLKMYWGGRLQHVGTMTARFLWDELNHKIGEACPPGTVGHKACPKGMDEHLIQYTGFASKGNWDGGGWLKVNVPLVYIPAGHESLREAFMELIPGIYSTQIEENDNCSTRDFKNKKGVVYCRVPEFVLVMLDARAWMVVHVQFNGYTDEQVGGCKHSKARTLKFYESKAAKMFSDAMGTDITISASCWDEKGNMIG